jgi:peptide/nickel transport system permease protein
VGESYAARQSLFFHFAKFMPDTMVFACVALSVIVSVSLFLGVLTAVRKDGPLDYIVRFFSFVGVSVPDFELGLVLIFTFAVGLGWFRLLDEGAFKRLLMPVCAISVPLISRYVRQIRGAVLEEINQDYVTGAAARGVSQWRLIGFHVLPNAMPAILSSLNVVVGRLISSLAIIETVFIARGIGSLAVSSIRSRDYTMVQAYAIWMAIFYVAASFIIDVLVYLTDPRLRRKGTA